MSNKPLLFTLALILLLLAACHSKKNIATDKPIRNLSTSRILDSAVKHKFAPGYFSTKLDVDAELADDNPSFKVNVRMRLDSLIWAQATKLIIIGTAIITNDSVRVLNKMGDTYWARTVDSLSELLNADLSYSMLQDILLGNPVGLDPDEKYKSPSDTGFYYLSSHRKSRIRRAVTHDRAPRRHPIIYQYKFYPQTFKTYQVNISDMNDSTSLNIVYPEYEMIDSVLVPAAAEVEAVKGSKKIKLLIRYTRTKVNEKTDFPFTVPEGYKKL
jgi:hypothetical protein